MNVTEALKLRHTGRAFTPEPVDKETLLEILEAANATPSWANTQPWEIYLAAGEPLQRLRAACLASFNGNQPPQQDLARPGKWPPQIEERMHELGKKRFESLGIRREDDEARRAMSANGIGFFGAPAVVFICMDRSLSQWSVFDLGMLSQSIMLAATERSIGSAVAYAFVAYPQLIRAELDVPNEFSVVIGIALGHEDAEHVQNRFRAPRRPLTEVVRVAGL
ncbi:MAG: nitroreductase [Thermoleophilia bacterium]